MAKTARTVGMFVAIFVAVIGVVKIYETIAQTLIPNYAQTWHRYSLDLHFAVMLIALGLTAVWGLAQKA